MTIKTQSLRCRTHGRVQAELKRTPYTVPGDDLVVDNVAVWLCPTCAAVLAVPHESTGRISAALQAQADRKVIEVRVSYALEDLALGVNATLGTAGAFDPFTLPVHLGLQLVGDREAPDAAWRRFDNEPVAARARPRLHPDMQQRLKALAKHWRVDVSSVVRWLAVLAADTLRAGLVRPVSFNPEAQPDEAMDRRAAG